MPPRKYKKKAQRTNRKRRVAPLAGNNLGALARVNYARLSETRSAGNDSRIFSCTAYNFEVSLAGQPGRVAEIARLYQEFRISRVRFTLKTAYDTLAATPAAGVIPMAPQIYMLVNRDGDAYPSLTAMQRSGINPVSMAKDGNKTMSWRPTVVYRSETSPSIIKTSPWLNTSDSRNTGGAFVPNTTPHYGLNLYIDWQTSDANRIQVTAGTYELEVFFEFRRPFYPEVQGETATAVQNIAL